MQEEEDLELTLDRAASSHKIYLGIASVRAALVLGQTASYQARVRVNSALVWSKVDLVQEVKQVSGQLKNKVIYQTRNTVGWMLAWDKKDLPQEKGSLVQVKDNKEGLV